MTQVSETMVAGAITFMLIAWTLSLVFLMYKIDKDMDYLTQATEYHGRVLKEIEINMEPINQFKGLTQYRTFSCTIGDGQIVYD